MPTKNNDYLVNEAIRFPKVLVIDSNGNEVKYGYKASDQNIKVNGK